MSGKQPSGDVLIGEIDVPNKLRIRACVSMMYERPTSPSALFLARIDVKSTTCPLTLDARAVGGPWEKDSAGPRGILSG